MAPFVSLPPALSQAVRPLAAQCCLGLLPPAASVKTHLCGAVCLALPRCFWGLCRARRNLPPGSVLDRTGLNRGPQLRLPPARLSRSLGSAHAMNLFWFVKDKFRGQVEKEKLLARETKLPHCRQGPEGREQKGRTEGRKVTGNRLQGAVGSG